MRVIAGTARSMPLKTIKGKETRPTTDKIKETLFNMIQTELPGCLFLDLFAGSGAIGIEALSRGAQKAVFIEKNRKSAAVINENLTFTKLNGKSEVLTGDVLSWLKRLQNSSAFDIIFMDPPYNQDWEKKVLAVLSDSGLANEDTLIIVECANTTKLDYVFELGYNVVKEKKYQTNKHIFLKKNS